MSKEKWTTEKFQTKNAERKAQRAKDLAAYHRGRDLRKSLTHNGCFGTVDKKLFNELAVGTSGYKD